MDFLSKKLAQAQRTTRIARFRYDQAVAAAETAEECCRECRSHVNQLRAHANRRRSSMRDTFAGGITKAQRHLEQAEQASARANLVAQTLKAELDKAVDAEATARRVLRDSMPAPAWAEREAGNAGAGGQSKSKTAGSGKGSQDAAPRPAPTQRTVITQADIDAFHASAEAAFADYSAMQTFPSPPRAPCGKSSCEATQKTRALKACPCNVRTLFAGFSKPQLKKARIAWHPDKFAQTPETGREGFQKKATEVFVVISEMLD